MARLDIGKATASNLSSFTEYAVDSKQLDSVGDQEETTWINAKWSQYWGYFSYVPDLKSAILMKAIWNVGKGWTADARTEVILDHITGWGKDKFSDILFNMEVIRRVNGDSFAEIMRSEDGKIINLKPLDPSTVRIVVDRKGIIIRYEQIAKVKGTNAPTKFQPEDIFHLSNNRMADQIHGISDIESVEKIILADEESFSDMKKVMHRQAKPLIMFKLGTDDQQKINAFVTKMDEATNKGENIYIPDDENAVSYEVVQVNPSAIIMQWRDDIRNKFYRTIGLPQIVPGGGGQSTESESKVIYLAFEQLVEHDQRFIEDQVWEQLQLRINLIPPATLSESLQQDTAKDGGMGGQMGFQPSDMMAGAGR